MDLQLSVVVPDQPKPPFHLFFAKNKGIHVATSLFQSIDFCPELCPDDSATDGSYAVLSTPYPLVSSNI